jgi:hydrogenase maturation protein HypF
MPYDRPLTSMNKFALCPSCLQEYELPDSRRFHAQPIACPDCGPQVAIWDERGREVGRGTEAIRMAARRLCAGEILAVKGLGGFQLLARADLAEPIVRLRRRKGRPSKPLAVMVKSMEMAESLVRLTPAERQLLASPANPIVLVEKLSDLSGRLAPEIAPGMNRLGVLVPTTPLHHLLLAEVDFVVVATSGNRGDEPIVTDERQALASLAGLADAFLVHDRPVVHRVDDSVFRVIAGREVAVRLARGYTPLSLPALERWAGASAAPAGVLATGAQQKVSLALWSGAQAVLSPHVGDMDGAEARAAFLSLTREFAGLYGCEIAAVACDLHPDYFTTRWARGLGLRVLAVQHHHAHAVACMVEHDLLDREVLALTWDGTGYGPDATVWGGEVLRVTVDGYERIASLRPFPLPGSEAAIRQPNRVALGVLASTLGSKNLLSDPALLHRLGFRPNTARSLLHMTDRGVNTPWTSSVGRLFDAVAALLLQTREVSYEGEAAAWLEAVVDPGVTEAYPLPLGPAPVDGPQVGGPGLLSGDWRPLFRALLEDTRLDVPVGISAARFHNALVEWTARVVVHQPCAEVVLGGGCFQNGWLTERTKTALQNLGRRVYCPGRIPPGDGGLAAGQLAIALAALNPKRKG